MPDGTDNNRFSLFFHCVCQGKVWLSVPPFVGTQNDWVSAEKGLLWLYMVSKGVSHDNPCIYLKFKDIGKSLTVSGY